MTTSPGVEDPLDAALGDVTWTVSERELLGLASSMERDGAVDSDYFLTHADLFFDGAPGEFPGREEHFPRAENHATTASASQGGAEGARTSSQTQSKEDCLEFINSCREYVRLRAECAMFPDGERRNALLMRAMLTHLREKARSLQSCPLQPSVLTGWGTACSEFDSMREEEVMTAGLGYRYTLMPICVVDYPWIVDANKSFCDLFELDILEVQAHKVPFGLLIPPEKAESLSASIHQVFSQGVSQKHYKFHSVFKKAQSGEFVECFLVLNLFEAPVDQPSSAAPHSSPHQANNSPSPTADPAVLVGGIPPSQVEPRSILQFFQVHETMDHF